MNISNKETQSRKKEVTIKFMTLNNRNLSYVARERIINFYTIIVLSHFSATGSERLQGK